MSGILGSAIRLLRGKYGVILVLLAANLILGLLITADYGESIDEFGDFKYGEDSLQAYITSGQVQSHGDRDYYGPFYLMAASALSDVFSHLRSDWMTSEGRHFTNFLTFQMGVFFFYLLATRYVDRASAIAVTLLFCFQPLLFGHSFINQKDIPFMAFFTASVALGLIAVDAWAVTTGPAGGLVRGVRLRAAGVVRWAAEDWRKASRRLRWSVFVSLVLAGLLAFDLIRRGLVLGVLQNLVRGAYAGTAGRLVTLLFDLVATDAYKTPVDLYLDKLTRAYLWLRVPAILVAFLPAMILLRSLFKGTIDGLGPAWFKKWALVVLAGAAMGLCTSIRVAGPFAGVLITVAFMTRLRWKSTVPLAGYWTAAVVSTYATWPFLWHDTLGRFLQSIRLAGDFPSHSVLYDGQLISSGSLPWHYLPRLIGIELTEPALLLAVLGVVVCISIAVKRLGHRVDLAVMGLWLSVPAAAVIFLGTPLYGNIRQLLFILPPLFIAVAYGLSQVLVMVKNGGLQVLVVGLILAPGLVAIIRLHPYEYSYYNSLVGGVDGAFGRYEIDPWCISYREATEYVNRVAPLNATVAVPGTETGGVVTFARSDLIIKTSTSGNSTAEFAIACKRAVAETTFHPEMVTVYQVRRGKAILAEVKRMP
jgi:hypothetical protein